MKVLDAYTSAMAADIATDRMAKVRQAGIEKIGFAWAGEGERGKKHYYRVQGPTFLVEFDNTQDDGNHIHSVWRDFNGDFGRDLLRDHINSAHRQQPVIRQTPRRADCRRAPRTRLPADSALTRSWAELSLSGAARAERVARQHGKLPAVRRDLSRARPDLSVAKRFFELDEERRRKLLQLTDRPFDLSKDRARSDDDHRHRLVVSGAVASAMAPATTIQGTDERPAVDGEFIDRNAGSGRGARGD